MFFIMNWTNRNGNFRRIYCEADFFCTWMSLEPKYNRGVATLFGADSKFVARLCCLDAYDARENSRKAVCYLSYSIDAVVNRAA